MHSLCIVPARRACAKCLYGLTFCAALAVAGGICYNLYMKKAVSLIIAAICALLCFTACADNTPRTFDNTDRCEYVLDENGFHLANINYDDYLTESSAPDSALDVCDFGASITASAEVNRRAINKAIERASETGGCVKVSGGTYYTGTIVMLSNVTLFIEKGAALSLPKYDDRSSTTLDTALVIAKNADNWTITGAGMLHGQGTDYTKEAETGSIYYPPEEFSLKERVLQARARIRPRKSEDYNVIYAYNCENIRLNNLLIYESSYWTVNLDNCNGADISNVVIDNNMHVANSDGIDICSSKNVRVSRCFIATGDDGIVLKSPSASVENVTVDDCAIMSLANNFKIGTETGYDVKNVDVGNCYFFTAECTGGYSGIAVESADGANISSVRVHDIVMDNVTSVLLVWLGCRLDENNGSRGLVGSIDGIKVENIDANNIDLPSAVVGCEYNGTTYRVENVTLANITAKYRDCNEKLVIFKGDDVLAANMNGYPEITRVSHKYVISHSMSRYYDMPCYGLYSRDTQNLTVENFSVTPRTANTRPAFSGDIE